MLKTHCIVLALILPLCATRLNLEKSDSTRCNWKPNGTAPNATVSYLGAHLWRAYLDTEAKLMLVDELEQIGDLQNWGLNNDTYNDIFVEFRYVQNVSKLFADANIKYAIATTNFQEWIDNENLMVDEKHAGHNMSWSKYHRLADIESFIDYLLVTYPKLCSATTIGASIEGRKLRVLKISNKRKHNKAVWVDGGIHGREWISPATVTYVIKSLVENWNYETSTVRNTDWHFLPVLNPDGYEFAHTHDRLWRKNRRQNGTCPGTDLNRNFGADWGGVGASKCPCHDVYAGASPFSEPESLAVKHYITVIEKKALWKGFVTFHSYGQIIYHPGETDHAIVAEKMQKEMRSVCGITYTTEGSEADPTMGSSDGWAGSVVGIKYPYTIELRDLGQYTFVLPASNIKPSGEEGLAAMRVIANAVNTS